MRAFPFASTVAALALVAALAGALAAVNPTAAMAQAATVTTPSGLKITDTKVGTGATPKPGQI